AVLVIHDPAVLQEPAHNTADSDVFADPGNAGAQRAHAANDQINFYSGLGGPVQGLNYVLVQQSVHLGDDSRRPAGPGVFCFALNVFQGGRGKINGRDGELSITGSFRVSGEVIENRMHGGGDMGRGREQAYIGVKTRRRRIVVAGADVNVPPGYAV